MEDPAARGGNWEEVARHELRVHVPIMANERDQPVIDGRCVGGAHLRSTAPHPFLVAAAYRALPIFHTGPRLVFSQQTLLFSFPFPLSPVPRAFMIAMLPRGLDLRLNACSTSFPCYEQSLIAPHRVSFNVYFLSIPAQLSLLLSTVLWFTSLSSFVPAHCASGASSNSHSFVCRVVSCPL